MLEIDDLKKDMLNVGKLKLLLADIPNDYQIAIAYEGYNEVTNNVKIDVVSDDFGYVVFGGYPAESNGFDNKLSQLSGKYPKYYEQVKNALGK